MTDEREIVCLYIQTDRHGRKRDRERQSRQTNKLIDGQIDRQAGRQQTDGWMDKQADR